MTKKGMSRTGKRDFGKQRNITGHTEKKFLRGESLKEGGIKLDNRFCSIKDVYGLVLKSSEKNVDEIYFKATIELMKKKIGTSQKYVLTDEWMDLQSFLVLTHMLQDWYTIRTLDVAEFINQKFKEKYAITRDDILGIISSAMEEKPKKAANTESKSESAKAVKKTVSLPEPKGDMHKVVQNALKNGATKTAVQKKYKLTQRELFEYMGYKYWNDACRADHKAMLEYMRLHPNASGKEAIEKACGKTAVGYRFALVPTKEQQEAYNRACSESAAAPKAKIKGSDVKSLILSDVEREEQQALYEKIKEIANARNVSPREVTTSFKARLTKDYGIVIDQIKKDLMMKFRVNHGEGKAPNALEAIAMSEYLPVAKSVLDAMLEESYTVK